YRRPDGAMQKIKLLRKDQYMIVDGKIKFLSSEVLGMPQELIYEEYFSTKKKDFILPEIVAQMEKAQDQVIRAFHKGSFLISGPDGSGKTTLALHRVAYLTQSPDLADIYKSKTVVVFVQDEGTRGYFSHLLPELGIDDVKIVTFSQWAFEILDIKGVFLDRFGKSEDERDLYEFQKLKALKKVSKYSGMKNDNFSILEKIYEKYFNQEQKRLFQKQKEGKFYDRIDLTLLLKIFYRNNKGLSVIRDSYIEQKNGLVKKKRGPVFLEYSLAVIDEFQNYLPDQLELMKSCINKKNQALVYVGDMAQQVKLGTIRRWEDIGEKMEGDRKVILQKVYRNTKNILLFIKKLGYQVEILPQLKEGVEVREYLFQTKDQEIEKIKNIIKNSNFSSIGILAKEDQYLVEFRNAFSQNNKIHIMTMSESQGVEFDWVILVGISQEAFFVSDEKNHSELAQEKKRINKDLLYVALTRAISQLYVMGKEKLQDIIHRDI
ncbi:MAG: 3'-5' exonuclease, partial [Candidatus Moraniibacteriota bacterium]